MHECTMMVSFAESVEQYKVWSVSLGISNNCTLDNRNSVFFFGASVASKCRTRRVPSIPIICVHLEWDELGSIQSAGVMLAEKNNA